MIDSRTSTIFTSFLRNYFLIGFLLTVVLLWPLTKSPFFSHQDDVQVIRLQQMDECFRDFQIPCRWVPDLGGYYGYPLFNYYAPLPYYAGELFYFATKSLFVSVKLMFSLAFLSAYVFMYLAGRRLWGSVGGSLSAVFYSYAPYHALDFYVRGAMGEMWAMMLFPAILWALLRLYDNGSVGNILLVSLFSGGLVLSHNLSAAMFLPLIFVLSLVLSIYQKNRKFLYKFLISISFAAILSGFYWIPAVFEKKLVHVDSTTIGYFHYTEHFKGLRKMVLDRSWEFGTSVREVPGGEKDRMSYQIGIVHLIVFLIVLIGMGRMKRISRVLAASFVFAAVFSVFMVHPRSVFLWDLFETLKYLQFPWRFLIITAFSISCLSGAILTYFSKKNTAKIWFLLCLAVVALNFNYFRPEKFVYTPEKDFLAGNNLEKQLMRSVFDFLPIFAEAPPAHSATVPFTVLVGDVEVVDYKKGSDWIDFRADVKTHSIIRLSQYYFPNWRVFVDEKEVLPDYENNSLGLMTFILGEGNHRIYAGLYNTKIRLIGNIITSIGILVFAALSLLQLTIINRRFNYYLNAFKR